MNDEIKKTEEMTADTPENNHSGVRPSSPAQGLSSEAGAKVNDTLAKCLVDRDAWKDKFIRLQADFDNFTKRNEKERIQWATAAQAALLNDILPIVDDFDRAMAQISNKEIVAELKTWLEGFQFIHKALYKFLEKYDVEEIPASKPFDPKYHEALVQVESPEHKSGEIVAILQKGFIYKGNVLRPAKVSVAK